VLTCQEVSERASAHVDGELRGMAWVQFRLHLMMCDGCGNFVSQVRRTKALIRSVLDAGRPAVADQVLLRAYSVRYAPGPASAGRPGAPGAAPPNHKGI